MTLPPPLNPRFGQPHAPKLTHGWSRTGSRPLPPAAPTTCHVPLASRLTSTMQDLLLPSIVANSVACNSASPDRSDLTKRIVVGSASAPPRLRTAELQPPGDRFWLRS